MSVKYYLEDNVFVAAQKRISWLFDEFENVVVGYSGGKDSTVILELAILEARKRNVKIPVMFLDQEAEWEATRDMVRYVMDRPEVKPYWLQVPIILANATSASDDWLHCWDPEAEDRWMRPREPDSLKENIYGTNRFAQMFTEFLRVHFGDGPACYISGVRTEESPTRMMGLTHNATYKWVTWGKVLDKARQHYTFYPIYDWSLTDVWKAIEEHGWRYNRIYDAMAQYGVPIRDMRISNVHHETAVKALFWLQEIEPKTYAKLTQRIGGIDMAGKMGVEDYFVRRLPPMFRDWAEYRDFLLDKLIDPKHQLAFLRRFERQEQMYQGLRSPSLEKAQVSAILANDYHLTKLENFDHMPQSAGVRRTIRKKQANEKQDRSTG